MFLLLLSTGAGEVPSLHVRRLHFFGARDQDEGVAGDRGNVVPHRKADGRFQRLTIPLQEGKAVIHSPAKDKSSKKTH